MGNASFGNDIRPGSENTIDVVAHGDFRLNFVLSRPGQGTGTSCTIPLTASVMNCAVEDVGEAGMDDAMDHNSS